MILGLSVILFISILFIIILLILVNKLLKKIVLYEQYIIDFKEHVANTLSLMREIDSKGTFFSRIDDKGKFESDDEVGQAFLELVNLIEKLNEIVK